MSKANQILDSHGVVLFDGVCNFCDASVQFIHARDKNDYFRFAPLQSAMGAKLKEQYGLGNIDSVVLVENGRAFTRSTAALRIARRLQGVWSWFYGFIVVPQFIRDFAYNLFAKNRYRLFGQKDACGLPTPELRKRFIDFA